MMVIRQYLMQGLQGKITEGGGTVGTMSVARNGYIITMEASGTVEDGAWYA